MGEKTHYVFKTIILAFKFKPFHTICVKTTKKSLFISDVLMYNIIKRGDALMYNKIKRGDDHDN